MEYRNVAFGYVPQAGYVRLEWAPNGDIKATRMFTGQTMDLCGLAHGSIPEDAEPQALFEALASDNEHSLFGEPATWSRYEALWGDDSMHRRARHGNGMGITSDSLLKVLQKAASWDRIEIAVEHLEAPAAWQAGMHVPNPHREGEWFDPVLVDAGDLRTMLRTADYLIPADSVVAGAVVDLLQADGARVAKFIEHDLAPYEAEFILEWAIFGSGA
ncbi:hypothetical protein ACIQ9Q_09635 [Streptomyces sp. NPDC094438]|uniref:hypothetical protein n=1 Tax=Streptomyces sp. NPDC094438 TaxID=3366061 RepID=UPI00381D261B